jgi:hypothetical protein
VLEDETRSIALPVQQASVHSGFCNELSLFHELIDKSRRADEFEIVGCYWHDGSEDPSVYLKDAPPAIPEGTRFWGSVLHFSIRLDVGSLFEVGLFNILLVVGFACKICQEQFELLPVSSCHTNRDGYTGNQSLQNDAASTRVEVGIAR